MAVGFQSPGSTDCMNGDAVLGMYVSDPERFTLDAFKIQRDPLKMLATPKAPGYLLPNSSYYTNSDSQIDIGFSRLLLPPLSPSEDVSLGYNEDATLLVAFWGGGARNDMSFFEGSHHGRHIWKIKIPRLGVTASLAATVPLNCIKNIAAIIIVSILTVWWS